MSRVCVRALDIAVSARTLRSRIGNVTLILRMKMIQRMRTVLLWLCLWSAVLLGSCRISPERRPSEPATAPENPAPQANLPANEPNSVQAPESSKQPPKEAIARVLPESLIAAPDKNSAARAVDYNTLIATRSSTAQQNSGWRYRTTRRGEIVGFEFSNYGGNRILPARRDASKNQFYTRDFQFRFDERARQDIHLMVSDWVPSRDRVFRLSEIMNSLMLFFPRKFLPAIVNAGERNIVSLPTGEAIEFDASTQEIRGGVFLEAAVDFNPDGSARKFPAIEYRGKGLLLRIDARGKDPRIANIATITIGTPPENCTAGITCNRCQVPSKELWQQTGAERFKFSSDAEFDQFLVARCGFGLPKLDAEVTVTTLQ